MRSPTFSLMLWTLLLPAGCEVSSETFPDQAARRICRHHKDCSLTDFFTLWPGGTLECREDEAARIASQRFGMSSSSVSLEDTTICKFVELDAMRCLEDLKEPTCDDILDRGWVEACTAVWDCVVARDG
ncbi:MAG: hypothetical protein ACON5B_01645 [Myxococcota bacterium]